MIVNHTSVVSVVPSAHAGVYHASKASSAMLSDTLRLELKLFGIRVVEIKTGGVRSNFVDNLKAHASAAPKLPEGSIYVPAREEIESVMRGENTADTVVESEVWARSVVSALVKRDAEGDYLGRVGMVDGLVADCAADFACGDGWAVA
jgi:1-acylglycerone phosphate reductase